MGRLRVGLIRFGSDANAEDSASTQCAPSYLRLSSSFVRFDVADAHHRAAVQQLAQTTHQGSVARDQIYIEPILLQGTIVTFMDHEGMQSSLAAGPLEGHAVLDAVRATIAFGPHIGLLPKARSVLWGYSGGRSPSRDRGKR